MVCGRHACCAASVARNDLCQHEACLQRAAGNDAGAAWRLLDGTAYFNKNPTRRTPMNKAEIPVAQRAVLSMLLDDHREVKKLFKAFQQEKDKAAGEQIVREACEKLTVHTQLEEEVFYPFVRDNGGEAFKDLVDEAVVEHATAKDLIEQLNGMEAGDDLFAAKFTVLAEYVSHHVEEEETELFPKLVRQHVDLTPLQEPMTARKEALLAETAS
jgi:hemerythrin superfamily protein